MNKDNGGPAFPCELSARFQGMTLRDYFAIHATDSDIRQYSMYKTVDRVTINGTLRSVHTDKVLDVPASRYAYADAMIAERAK